jgi:hypothetical protein
MWWYGLPEWSTGVWGDEGTAVLSELFYTRLVIWDWEMVVGKTWTTSDFSR